MKNVRFSALSATGSRFISTTAASVPPMINGVRLPIRVLIPSENLPKSGSRNRASTLSNAMIMPAISSGIPKVFLRISGTTLSYNCQNAQMERNAMPTKTVRL